MNCTVPQFLTNEQLIQLAHIEPSRWLNVLYYPCEVTCRNGEIQDRVYVVDRHLFRSQCAQTALRIIQTESIVEIRESPSRLPARFANELYQIGETGWGYILFTVEFNNGFRASYMSPTGTSDFIRLPKGQCSKDIVAVFPGVGDSKKAVRLLDYTFCMVDGLQKAVLREPATS